MTCAACKKRERTQPWKDWAASEPRCAFPNGGPFDSHNWNCATANLIRDLCGDFGDDHHPAVDFRNYNVLCDNGDQKYATIELPEFVEFDYDSELRTSFEHRPMALWVTWYKRRGCTEEMWLLMEKGSPQRPTETDCVTIIEALVAIEDSWRGANTEFAERQRQSGAPHVKKTVGT